MQPRAKFRLMSYHNQDSWHRRILITGARFLGGAAQTLFIRSDSRGLSMGGLTEALKHSSNPSVYNLKMFVASLSRWHVRHVIKYLVRCQTSSSSTSAKFNRDFDLPYVFDDDKYPTSIANKSYILRDKLTLSRHVNWVDILKLQNDPKHGGLSGVRDRAPNCKRE